MNWTFCRAGALVCLLACAAPEAAQAFEPDAGGPCDGVTCDDPTTCMEECCGSCDMCATLGCDDGDACNGVETCDPTTGCMPGAPLECDDGDLCNGYEACDPAAGCAAGSPLSCDDGDMCNGAEQCEPTAGCVPGAPLECLDGDLCNGYESCDPAGGCVHGTPLECDDGEPCNGVELCDATAGCGPGVPVMCDDGIDCTTDSCDSDGNCVHKASDGICTDGNGEACLTTACKPGLGGCVDIPVPDGTSCSNPNMCTLGDSCLGGVCVDGTPMDCSDGSQCTVDTCESSAGECTNTMEAGMCETCAPQVTLPDVDISFEEEFPISLKCPLVGGSAGVDVTVKGHLTLKGAKCPECVSETGGDAAVEAKIQLCKGATVTAKGGGGYNATRQFCTECDDETCELSCSDKSCDTETFNGFAGVGIERFYGFKNRWQAGGGSILPTISIAINCGVGVGGEVDVEAGYTGVTDNGCDPCEECNEVSGTVGVGVTGTGGCGAKLRVSKFSAKFGCMECGKLGVKLTGGGSKQWGECGEKGCINASITGDAGITLPCWDIGLWWFQVAVQCQAGASATCNANSCGGSGCAKPTVNASCTVSRGGC